MQLPASIRELFLNPTANASIPGFVLSLCLAAVLGLLLGQAYIHFGQSLSNRRLFARNFLLLAVTTTLIISIVKSSLALSLGLVGALSIVRFRAAIKEPEELAFLFLAISIGLGLGAGQALVTIVALTIILVLIALRSLIHRAPDQPNFFLTVTSPSPAKLSPRQILDALAEAGAQARLKRFDETPDRIEAAFLVDFRDVSRLETFSSQLRNLNPQVQVSCLDDRGLAA
ncbi:MAG TPA: DUF4956 domain-containing protein [Candidatus Paceibacterota bacterium]|nr:DUF4956 domain-containing protein [Verrucomicrobiota bacterium]HRZ43644.1 DUF4956 domain-containing protein [Candidatus Paceibacterota bacterium]HRZ91746.1 DUF4956 domain-containing protein [Candidatus Paceibacterota bacterium]